MTICSSRQVISSVYEKKLNEFQLKSCGLIYKIPALETVAGVAFFKLLISKSNLILGERAIRSLLAKVSN